MAWTTGYEDGGPLKVGVALPDPTGGMHAVVAMLAALEERDRTGNGCFIDLSQFETYGAVGGEKYLEASVTGEAAPRLANRSLDHVPQGAYPCRGDDEWIAISVQSDEEWTALEGVIGAVPGAGDLTTRDARKSGQDQIDDVIRAWTTRRDRFEAMTALQSVGVRASAVMTNRDLVESEHIDARGFIVEWDQVDVGPRKYPGFPVHFEDPAEIEMRSSPGLGQDNEHILVDILGYSPERVRELTDLGVLATTPE